jgi:hypothetical protein
MFRASICPSSGVQSKELPHMVCSTVIAGCGRIELGRQLCALCAIKLLILNIKVKTGTQNKFIGYLPSLHPQNWFCMLH